MYLFFFFFKQKTAYEMRISDWSSDVCSSDLGIEEGHRHGLGPMVRHHLDKLSSFEVMADVISRDLNKPETREATGNIGLGAVDGDPTAQRQCAERSVIHPLPLLDLAA